MASCQAVVAAGRPRAPAKRTTVQVSMEPAAMNQPTASSARVEILA